MDKFTVEQRSLIMSHIRSVDTKPEMIVRAYLHRQGFRFVLHDKRLPGKPDIVLPKYKTVVEVRGCFWHHHANCKEATTPTSNVEFWNEKFRKNMERDQRTEKALQDLGWRVIILWECEIKEKLERLPSIIRNEPNLTYMPAESAEPKEMEPISAAAEENADYTAESGPICEAKPESPQSIKRTRKRKKRGVALAVMVRNRGHRGRRGRRGRINLRRSVTR